MYHLNAMSEVQHGYTKAERISYVSFLWFIMLRLYLLRFKQIV